MKKNLQTQHITMFLKNGIELHGCLQQTLYLKDSSILWYVSLIQQTWAKKGELLTKRHHYRRCYGKVIQLSSPVCLSSIKTKSHKFVPGSWAGSFLSPLQRWLVANSINCYVLLLYAHFASDCWNNVDKRYFNIWALVLISCFPTYSSAFLIQWGQI